MRAATSSYLVPDRVDFKQKLVRRDKKGQHVLVKGIIQQEKLQMCMCPLHKANTIRHK